MQSQASSKSIGIWFSHWTTLTSKSWPRCPLSWSTIFNFGKRLMSARSYFYRNTVLDQFCVDRKNSSTLFKFCNNQSVGGRQTKFANHPIKIICVIYFFLWKSWLVVQNLRIAFIKMFISSKLFVWHLSRRIVRMESAEKWAAIYRKKPSRDWLGKDQWESVISVQSLSCIRILFLGRGRG